MDESGRRPYCLYKFSSLDSVAYSYHHFAEICFELDQPNIAQEVLKMSKTDSAEELGGGALNISGKQFADIVQLLTVQNQKLQEGNSEDQVDDASSLPPSTAATTTSSAAKKVSR